MRPRNAGGGRCFAASSREELIDTPDDVLAGEAAEAAVAEAAKTLRGITGADVVSMSAVVENDRITEFRTTVNVAFGIER